jgi:hypothetical protein
VPALPGFTQLPFVSRVGEDVGNRGEHIGGATDTFDAWRNGTLQSRLGNKGVSYDREAKLDPYSLLPKWLQPRKHA